MIVYLDGLKIKVFSVAVILTIGYLQGIYQNIKNQWFNTLAYKLVK